jgi:glycine/D-amino acid oxidase-like deaminating enzyme
MRVLIVGTGLAGALLADRLHGSGLSVRLLGAGGTDATAASGGLVRAFEPDPTAAGLARQSLAELHADPHLRRAAGYRETGSVYLLPAASLSSADVPGGAEVLDAVEVRRRFGFAGLPADTVGVHERRAGYLSPHRLRHAVLARLTAAGMPPPERVSVTAAAPDGTLRLADGRRLRGSVVLATGSGTPELLRASGLAEGPAVLRTKHIQVGRYPAADPEMPAFVDETSGLYGRGDGTGAVLLGVPSTHWDVAASGPPADPDIEARVRATAARRLPGVVAGPAVQIVSAADCYHPPTAVDPGGLALRALGPGLWTFTGGSGAAAKIALSATRVAAAELMSTLTVRGGTT